MEIIQELAGIIMRFLGVASLISLLILPFALIGLLIHPARPAMKKVIVFVLTVLMISGGICASAALLIF